MYFHISRHWNKTYQKNILSFRQLVSVRNNISIVALNYYFLLGNQVFGERSTPKSFQLRKESGRYCECFKFLVFFKLNLFQIQFLTKHHDSSSVCVTPWQPLKYNVLFLREEQNSFVYLYTITSWRHCCGTTKYKYTRVWTKHFKFCLKGAWGSLFIYYTFQVKLLFFDKKHLHSDVQIHDFVFKTK